jgi:hypothetical protein
VVTQASQVVEIYAAWVAISAIVLWGLAGWSTKRQLHSSAIVIAVLVTLVCIALLAYPFAAAVEQPRTPLQLVLADRASPLLFSFLVWPFAACIAVAQLSRRLTMSPRATHWASFAGSVVISCLSPPALLMAGCGLAGACF